MRSHVTETLAELSAMLRKFQYRKRYEITCDALYGATIAIEGFVSIPQAV